MTAKELRDYILTQMTAEDALLKLLEGSLLTYNKLRFPEKGEEIHPLILISMAAMDLGWDFLIEKEYEDIHGLTVGDKEYFERLKTEFTIQ